MPKSPLQTNVGAGRQLEQLLATLEHDLKNPVGNILGYLSLLRDDPDTALTATQADFLARIEQNCEAVLRILRDFVDLAHHSRAGEVDTPIADKASL